MRSPKDVLALGRMIVHELDLDTRGTVLERWLAHHLAEELSKVDNTKGQAKADAEARAVNLILKLWCHRRALPEPIDPLGGVREAIGILDLLAPDANPWRDYRRGSDQDLLRETFDILAKVVVTGSLLSGSSERKQPRPEEISALSAEEHHLLAMLDRWSPFSRSAFKPTVDELLARTDDLSDDSPVHAESIWKTPRARPEQVTELRNQIIEELLSAKTALEKLVDRWQRQVDAPVKPSEE